MEEKLQSAYISEHFQVLQALRDTPEKTVLKVRSNSSGKVYLLREFQGDPSVYERLLPLRSPYLPEIFEVISEGDRVTVLEEFVAGDQMAEMLQSCLFTEKETRKIGADLCQALHVLHGLGIVHRDIKPENIILRGDTAVLTDFDASRVSKTEQSRDTVAMGTVGFAAPEQFSISQTDSRADIYAMGVLLNTMMTGEHPSTRLAKGKMGRIVTRCTMINPRKRYQSIGRLLEELL